MCTKPGKTAAMPLTVRNGPRLTAKKGNKTMKADMHVHSKFSKRPSEWILKKLDCPESFTEPLNLYKICKQQGMSLVTITDHNVIDGCVEIAHYPDVFISEEVTTYFPDDGCKLHVLVYNILNSCEIGSTKRQR